jgi:DNA-binding transcriptional LysR family regulator
MVQANIGVALLPDAICRQLDRRHVRSVRVCEPTIPWNVALIWRRDGHLTPATRAWVELVGRRWARASASGAAATAARSP